MRIAAIGLGAIGQRVIEDLRREARATISAVCDLDAEVASKWAEELGGIPWATDYRKILSDELTEVAYIAVPPKFHHEVVLAATAAGKHILCEKPLALTLGEATEMAKAVQHAGVVNALNLPLHYASGTRTLRRELRSPPATSSPAAAFTTR